MFPYWVVLTVGGWIVIDYEPLGCVRRGPFMTLVGAQYVCESLNSMVLVAA
jgi:hypothetical protein